jgi:hypothetical protein
MAARKSCGSCSLGAYRCIGYHHSHSHTDDLQGLKNWKPVHNSPTSFKTFSNLTYLAVCLQSNCISTAASQRAVVPRTWAKDLNNTLQKIANRVGA